MTPPSITDYKLNAWLAEAAYADFSDAMSETGDKRDKVMIKALQSRSDNSPGLNFTPEQAEAFAERYDLVHQTVTGAYPVGHPEYPEGNPGVTKNMIAVLS